MASIDPDVAVLLDELNERINVLESPFLTEDTHAAIPHGGNGTTQAVDAGIRYASLAGDNTDGLSWATAFHSVKDAAVAAGRDSLVMVGKGRYYEEGLIPWHRGQIIQALAPWATDVRLADNGTPPLFVSDPGLPDTEFLHGSGIRDIKIRGNGAAGAGPVVEINCRIGEETVIENVQIHASGGDGIHAKRGGQPVFWRGIHIFGGSQYGSGYGINLERTGGDIWNSAVLHGISGDNNELGLVRFASAGSGNRENEQLTIIGLKAESNGVRQRDAVVLDGTHLAVTIIGAATRHGSTPGNSLVKILGNGNSPVLLQNIATGFDHIIDDQVAEVTVDRRSGPGGEAVSFLFYNRGVEVMRLGSDS